MAEVVDRELGNRKEGMPHRRRGPDSYYWCFNRRNPKSTWGKASRERANRMIRDGLMTRQGLDMIELAKRSGTWEAHLEAESLVIPTDLKRQLERNREARENFEDFAPSSKRIVLQWIEDAKRPETRERRIKQTVELAEENQIAGLPKGLRENRSRRNRSRRSLSSRVQQDSNLRPTA